MRIVGIARATLQGLDTSGETSLTAKPGFDTPMPILTLARSRDAAFGMDFNINRRHGGTCAAGNGYFFSTKSGLRPMPVFDTCQAPP
jgi:hypothetical protein